MPKVLDITGFLKCDFAAEMKWQRGQKGRKKWGQRGQKGRKFIILKMVFSCFESIKKRPRYEVSHLLHIEIIEFFHNAGINHLVFIIGSS